MIYSIYLSLILSECGPTFIEAVKNGEMETIKKTIDSNADDVDLDHRLYYAARGGHLPVVKQCIKRGANPNFILSGFSPLHESVYNDQLEVTDFLLQNGANVYIYNKIPVRSRDQTSALPVQVNENDS